MRPRAELTASRPIRRIGSDSVRAVLIVNPNATSTTAAGRDLLAHALESRVKLTVTHTDHRGHAIEIARDAVRDSVDVLIVHGGDGTVNEVRQRDSWCGRPQRDCPRGRGAPRRLGKCVRACTWHQPRPDRGDESAR